MVPGIPLPLAAPMQAPLCCITKYCLSTLERQSSTVMLLWLWSCSKGSWGERFEDTYILKPPALIKQVPFLSTQQTPTTFSEATNLLCPHSQRGCFLTWHFQANTLAPGENRSRCLEEAQLHLNYDSKLISMFQTFHWMQNTCQRTLQQARSHSRTGTHKRKALFSLSPPFERLTPW